MSKFAPSNGDSSPLTKFAEWEALSKGPFSAKNGVQYYKLTINITPWIDANNPPQNADEFKVKTFKMVTAKWNAEYTEVLWPSIVTGNSKTGYTLQPHLAPFLKSADDLFTEPGQPAKRFYVSYQTPELLVKASADDIQYAKDHDRLDSLVLNTLGQAMKKRYPVKIVQIYGDFTSYDAAARANAQKAPVVAQPQSNPDKEAHLTALKAAFVPKWLTVGEDGVLKDVDLFQVENDLRTPPFNAYLTMDSPEVKKLVIDAIIARLGNNMEAIVKVVSNTNGWIDPLSSDLTAAIEGMPF